MGLVRDIWRMWQTDWPHENVRRVLLVQTANPPAFNGILCAVRRRFHEAEIILAIHPETEKTLPRDHGCRICFINRKGKRECVRELRSLQCDTVIACFCAERGFWKLKLLPFLLGPRQFLIYNENADAYPLNRQHFHILCKHIKWRARNVIRRETDLSNSILRLLIIKALRIALAPAAFMWLAWRAAAWERRRRRNARNA